MANVAAIDMDGTLTDYPALAALSHALKAAGWAVHVLTGFSHPGPFTPELLAEKQRLREAQADALGVARDSIRVTYGRNSSECGAQKAAFCRERGVTLFVDDAGLYCDLVKHACPGCCVLRVHEP